MREESLRPIHLFEINRAAYSIPGISWPESYYATSLPGYNVYALTISQDSADSYDYYDLAIGCFTVDNGDQIADKAAMIIQSWWQFQHQQWNQWVWKQIVKSGLIDAGSAFHLRDNVWKKAKNHEGILPKPHFISCRS